MRKLADVRENMDELWVVEVYDTIEDADDFWGERYETIERAVYLVNEDDDASDIWLYYQTVINWAKMLFPTKRPKINAVQDWGLLYNKYHNNKYNPNDLEKEIQKLLMDDDVTKKDGIIPYVLSEKKPKDEKVLSLRAFTEAQKLRAYEKQKHQCPLCVKKGILDEYAFEDMQGDHIKPWSQGGPTTDDNLHMLCRDCNNNKSDK